ncbi:unnamed protein product [Adineta steineri]|uniref:Uncharacterized protein n=1 Tax=Adineta steineri TaxID=433720 RepID=A0A815GGH3_9BILA|nr:unnamed protein product [Adineta steineri]
MQYGAKIRDVTVPLFGPGTGCQCVYEYLGAGYHAVCAVKPAGGLKLRDVTVPLFSPGTTCQCVYEYLGAGHHADSEQQKNLHHVAVDFSSVEYNQALPKSETNGFISKIQQIKRLFHYATGLDWLYMSVATIVSIIHGITLPLLLIIFGNVTNSFTNRSSNLCTLNFTSLSQLYCPSNITLDQSNIQQFYFLCNFTGIDSSKPSSNFSSQVGQQSVYVVAIGCVVLLFGYIQATLWTLTSERQTYRMRQAVFRLLINKDMTYFDTHNVGQMNTVLMENINRVKNGIGYRLGTVIQCLTIFISGFIVGLVKSWKLSLVLLSFSPILVICLLILTKVMSKMTKMELSTYGKASAIAQEVLSSMRIIYAYNGADHEYHRYTQHLTAARRNGVRKGIFIGIIMGFIRFIIFIIYAVGFIYGTRLIYQENSNIGDIFVVFFAIFIAVFSLGQATNTLRYQNEALCAVDSIRSLLDIDILTELEHRVMLDKKPNICGNIVFDNVSFIYLTRPNTRILSDLTFRVQCGETIAILGSNGSGKSTCLQLLQGFYQPTNGTITIDGIPLSNYDLQWLRQNMAVVSQEPVLFSTTIRQNIMYGNPNATESNMLEVAKLTNVDRIVEKFPQGYDTMIGDNSSHQLSGGQKQLICIARALINRPKLLFLDECTSALDRTTIIVTHRISTIRYATRILVMQDGRIIEQGTHEELMELQNVYYNMINDYEQHDRMIDSIESITTNINDNKTNQLSTIPVDETIPSNADRKVQSPFWYMLKMNRPEWLYILFGCLACFCTGGFQPAIGVLISKIIANSLFAYSGEALTQRIRSKIFRTYLNQDITWFDDPSHNPGSLCLQLSSEASTVQKTTGVYIGTVLEAFGNLGIGTVLSFIYGWELTLVVIGFLPFLIVTGIVGIKLVDKFSKKDSKAFTAASQVSMEVLRNIRTVRQLNQEDYFITNYQTLLLKPHQFVTFYLNISFEQRMFYFSRSACKRVHITGFIFSFSNALTFFAEAALTAFAAFLVEKNRITFENVLIVFNCILLGAQAAAQTVSMSSDIGQASRASKNIFTLLERTSLVNNKCNEGLKLVNFKGSIQFDINSFTYPIRPNVPVLQNLRMNIEAGQSIALVGMYMTLNYNYSNLFVLMTLGKNGSGKSSIMQLLQRFYDVSDGQLLVDSMNLQHLNLQWYRSQVGYLSQMPVLFNVTIAENIAYGDLSRSVSIDEIIQAAKDAHAHSFIDNLPEKYNTMVGTNGEHLSGGQRQSVALARLLIRNPRILLLDECTSAMDGENEKAAEIALNQLKQNRTSIVIGHRLSTIRNVDIIYVLHHQGYIVESGTHETLMAARGYYYELALDLIH